MIFFTCILGSYKNINLSGFTFRCIFIFYIIYRIYCPKVLKPYVYSSNIWVFRIEIYNCIICISCLKRTECIESLKK